jgi:Zn-dependent protease with chaperone function
MAEELGNQAGVRVRRVVVKDEDQFVNAFATFFGTIGITRALRDQLPEAEIRAILAHEVGHLKARDVPRIFF